MTKHALKHHSDRNDNEVTGTHNLYPVWFFTTLYLLHDLWRNLQETLKNCQIGYSHVL